jgi:hypothetical protein
LAASIYIWSIIIVSCNKPSCFDERVLLFEFAEFSFAVVVEEKLLAFLDIPRSMEDDVVLFADFDCSGDKVCHLFGVIDESRLISEDPGIDRLFLLQLEGVK